MTNEEKIRQAQRAYHKTWRDKNPEKVKERNARYWLRRANKAAQEGKADERAE